MYLLPNGLDSPPVNPRPRTSKCLVIGRIEPRKRQLEVLDCAEQMDLPLTFIGSPNENHPAYTRAFIAKVRASKLCEWLGALTHDQVMEQLSTALCVVNLSWVEVQSLVELEGIGSGCWVVAGNSGGNVEFFPDQVFEFDPEETPRALNTVKRCVREFESEGRVADVLDQNTYPDWRDIGERLLNVYEDTVDFGRPRRSDNDLRRGPASNER
jgi:glycosyltransferase involved in cell wall biosynthesis